MTSVCHNPLDELSVSNFSSRGLPNDWRDRYFLDHYRSRSLHEFSTGFDYQLWNQHICQLSASNLAVRHALVALSAQHKIHVQQKRENYLDTASTAVYAIEHYGKSIQTVNSHTSKPAGQDNFVEETLVTCLLLLCFELLRGDDLAALTHLTGAMQIMDQVLDRPQPTTAIALRKECQPIALVAKTFARLDLQCSLYVGSRSPKLFLHDHFSETCSGPIPLLMSPNAKFTDITGACNALDCCIGRSYYFMRTSAEKKIGSALFKNFNSGATRQRWGGEKDWENQSQRRDAELYATLWTSYWAAFIALSASLNADECFYDRFSAEFNDLVQQAEQLVVLRLHGVTDTGCYNNFTPQIAVIQPLYFTALKCRNQDTRARAAALLKSSGKEGVWDGELMAQIAGYVMASEQAKATYLRDSTSIAQEGHFSCDGEHVGDRRIVSSDHITIPGYARIHGVAIESLDQKNRTVTIRISSRKRPSDLRSEYDWIYAASTLRW